MKMLKSFKYALQGFISAFKTEKNMKIHILATIIVIIFGIIYKINWQEWCFCVIAIVGVISAELCNTAIETVVNMVSPEIHPKAKLAKDIAAGAVLIFAIRSIYNRINYIFT